MHNSKPRVLILLDRLVIGGQAVDVIPLCYYLKPFFDVHIAYGQKKASDSDANFLLSIYPDLCIYKLRFLCKTANPIKNILAYLEIKQLVKYNKPHIVHTNAVKCGVLGRLASSKLKVPIIIHTFHGHFFHSYFNMFFSKTIIAIEKRLAALTDIIVATSNAQAKDLISDYQICKIEKITVIELGLDDYFFKAQTALHNNLFKEMYVVDEHTISIGIIARIVKVKNFNMFVKVVKKVLETTEKKVQFFVIGDGPLKEQIQEQLSNYSISWCEKDNFTQAAKVVFTSWMPYIYSALQVLDIVILTSYNEGTGLSLVESQFFGKPVVATKVGGVPDTIINDKTGFLVANNDVNVFSEKLILLIEDDGLRKKMGEKAQVFAQKKFSKQAEVSQFIKLYQQLLANKNIPIN
jgi:glycosyltransferase involved in cell wall biosynthesis